MLTTFYILLLVYYGSIESTSIKVLMPDIKPQQKDLYLCHKVKLNDDKPIYITEFHPKALKETAHHMLLFTCAETINEDTWNCGEMASTKEDKNQFISGPVCTKSQTIIYAWAMDAPELILPKDVAFKIGGQTERKYLVVQVHYANVDKFLNGETDNSGVVLSGQHEPVDKLAGVFFTATGGNVKSNTEEHFEAACEMTEDIDIYPFAYRTHAHKLGLVNSGYLVKENEKKNEQEWIEIGRRSPQLPQMFYPIKNDIVISKGDIIATRCTMENTRARTVFIGSTNDDEMCNFYLMYYVKGKKTLNNNICYTAGPPFWYFKDFKTSDGKKLDLNSIPKDISEVPEMKEEEMIAMKEHMNNHMKPSEMKPNEMKSSEMNHNEMKASQMKQSQEEENSDETEDENEKSFVVPDEYEENLNELEKELYYKDVLLKYLLRKKQEKNLSI